TSTSSFGRSSSSRPPSSVSCRRRRRWHSPLSCWKWPPAGCSFSLVICSWSPTPAGALPADSNASAKSAKRSSPPWRNGNRLHEELFCFHVITHVEQAGGGDGAGQRHGDDVVAFECRHHAELTFQH